MLAGCWAARACCTACWMRACRSAGGVGGRQLWTSGLPCVRDLALLTERVEVALPLPRLVEHIVHPRNEVLHAAGECCVADVPHRVYEFDLTYAQS